MSTQQLTGNTRNQQECWNTAKLIAKMQISLRKRIVPENYANLNARNDRKSGDRRIRVVFKKRCGNEKSAHYPANAEYYTGDFD